MPIEDFHENTFVAFLDISGFKKMMKKNSGNTAWKALDTFYNAGFGVIRNNEKKINGIFFSDAGLLFARGSNRQPSDWPERLRNTLTAVKQVNEVAIRRNVILTTSVAYGFFKYQERSGFVGINKNAVYGEAYVSAYLDSEENKKNPGYCRIIKRNLPDNFKEALKQNDQDPILKMMVDKGNEGYYYYWNLSKAQDWKAFDERYREAEDSKYLTIRKLLKENVARNV